MNNIFYCFSIFKFESDLFIVLWKIHYFSVVYVLSACNICRVLRFKKFNLLKYIQITFLCQLKLKNMLQYYITRETGQFIGPNFSLLIKLAAKLDPIQKTHGIITSEALEDSFFQHKGTDKRNLIILFSDNPIYCKYIRVSYVGNYYFGFRINVMHFIKTFLAKEKKQRTFSANKFMYSYMLKNYIRNKWYETRDQYFFESRYRDHRKSQDIGILIDPNRKDMILKDLSAFLKFGISSEKEQYDLMKMFLKFKKSI